MRNHLKNRNIRVALISIIEIEVRGQGIPRYISELYKDNKCLESRYNNEIKKVYQPYNKLLGDALSFEFGSIMNKPPLNSFDIVHTHIVPVADVPGAVEKSAPFG